MRGNRIIFRKNKLETCFIGILLILVTIFTIPVTPTSLTNNNASADYVKASTDYVLVMDFTISDGGDSVLAGATITEGTTIEANGRSGVWTNLKYIDATGGDDWNVSADTIFEDDDGDDNYNSSHGDTVLAGATPADGTVRTGTGVRAGTWTTLKTYQGGADAWEPGTDSIVDDVDDNDVFLDQLNAITLQNTGTAQDTDDISTVVVWAEEGSSAGFQSGEDTILGTASWDASNSWDLSGLTQSVSSSSLRFYVTVNISGAPTSGRTVVMKVPTKNDANSDGGYDAGEEGIFTAGNESLGTITNANTITIDTVEPNSEVTIPANNGYYKSGDTIDSNISGTATDALSGIDYVNITIYNSTDGKYWTGTAWQTGVAWLNTDGTTTWYNDTAVPTWSSGKTYLVNSTAVDTAGNVESSADSNSFIYDTVDPAAPTFNSAEDQWYTSNPTLDIDFEDLIALHSAEYKIDSGGTYSTIATGISGTSETDNWQISTSDWNTMTNGTHYLYFRITDDAGNQYETADNDAGFTFKKDVSDPNSVITVPADGSYYKSGDTIDSNISGTASNGASGVDYVNITIYNSTDGAYWTGSAWQAGVAWLNTDGTTTWYNDTAVPTWTNGKEYYVNSTAVDVAGNIESSPDINSFTYDTEDPSGPSFTTEENQWFTENPTLNIDFIDNLNLYSAEYKVDSGGTYRTIATDISGTTYTTNWQMTGADWSGMTNGTHYLYFRVTDDAGNQYETGSNEAGFTLKKDTDDPSTTIVLPVDGTYYASGSGIDSNITGTASDTTSGVDHVNITIYNSTDGAYWTGTAWQAGVAWLNTDGTTTWYNDTAVPTWTTGKTYYVNSTVVDAAGNIESSPDSNSFTYDTAEPSTTIVLPVDGAYYKSGDAIDSNITGTATDALSDIDHVNITIYNSTNGRYWTGTAWQDDTSWLNTNGTTTWYNDSAVPTWSDGKSYTVNSSATDGAGNIESTDSNSFTYDTTVPTCTIEYNLSDDYFKADDTLKIYANFTEATSGMNESSTKISIDYAGGTDVDNASLSKTSNTNWYYDLTIPSGTEYDGAFTVMIFGDDNASNTVTTTQNADKTIDNTVPVVNIGFNKSATYFKEDDKLKIYANFTESGSGMNESSITIGLWRGGTWLTGGSMDKTDNTHWFYNYTIPSGDGTFSVRIQGSDNASNDMTDTWNTSKNIDNTGPSATITDISDYVASLTEIGGNSSDGSGIGIQKTQIKIYNTTDNTNWTGTTWTDADNWVDTTGYGTWTYDTSSITWESGKSFTAYAKSIDNLTNTGSTVEDSFSFDDVAPTVSSVVINDTTISSTIHLKNGDSINVTAEYADDTIDSSSANSLFKADLSDLGGGTSVSASGHNDTHVWWLITAAGTSNGTLTVTVNVTDNHGNYNDTESDTIIGDNVAPLISYSVLDADNDGTTNTYIDVFFNEAMDTNSFGASDFEISNSLVDVESIQSSASTRVTLKLDATLPTGDSPKVYMNGTITDSVGNAMATESNVTIWTYRIVLTEGWNLVSIPGYVSNVPIATLLADVSDNINTTFAYDPDSGWSSWSPSGGGSLTALQPGLGYWFKMDGADVLTGNYNLTYSTGGSAPSPPSQMLSGPGWNLIGQYQAYNQTSNTNGALASLNSVLSSSGEILYRYTVSGGFVNIYDNGNYDMEPGVGYWLWISDETSNAGYAPN